MRLGLNLGYWSVDNDLREGLELAERADHLGYSVLWAAEAYGSDAVSVLGWLAARTSRAEIGSCVMQIPGRSPALTAMSAATLDALSGGRFALGLGVSGPQVSEGWHGVRFDKPLARTREYVDIVRMALARKRVEYEGQHYRLPLADGPGKPLKLTLGEARADIPIYLAAVGPRNVELAGEIADGWLAVFVDPRADGDWRFSLGLTGERERPFDVVVNVPVAVGDDLEACADEVRDYVALYVGGMGSRTRNFYFETACRLGHLEAAERIRDHYLAGDRRAAAAAVPFQLIDDTSLLGSADRIGERMKDYVDAGVTTLTVASAAVSPAMRGPAMEAAGQAWRALCD